MAIKTSALQAASRTLKLQQLIYIVQQLNKDMQAVLIFILLLVLVVKSHPICTSGTEGDGRPCTENITANVMFLDKWLDLSDNSKGIDQLRRYSRNSVASKLLNSVSTPVSHIYIHTVN